MEHDFSQYPDDTMLAEFIMDIYANQDTSEITILYDLEFGEELMSVEYNKGTKTLDFIFSEIGVVPFGMPLQAGLCPYFEMAKDVTLLLMDTETNKAVSGITVPLNIK